MTPCDRRMQENFSCYATTLLEMCYAGKRSLQRIAFVLLDRMMSKENIVTQVTGHKKRTHKFTAALRKV